MEEFLNPIEVLNQLELRKDMIAADFGCGSGGWVIPLAKKLEKGKVYAIDVLEESLSALKSAAKLNKILNIETIRANVESEAGLPLIAGDSVDLVLMTNLLFQVENKDTVFSQAKRILKEGGKILVVDWKPEAVLGPKEGRVSVKEIKEIASKSDFKLEKEFNAGRHHYGLLFKK